MGMKPLIVLLMFLLPILPARAAVSPAVLEGCRTLAAKLSSIDEKTCLAAGLVDSGGRSVKNAPILEREFGPADNRKPQARVLLFGGIHGDEYSSMTIIFRWMEILEKHHTGLFHWKILPLLNPDGLQKTPKAERTNANNVDLNRNFPTPDWEKESEKYWISQTGRDIRRFPGKTPGSEPETRHLVSAIESFRPNVIISVHAPFGILDFDGPPTIPPRKLGHLYLSPLGTYPGSLGRYAGILKKIPVVTIELPHAGIMPSPQEVRGIWNDMVHWLKNNIQDPLPNTRKVAEIEKKTP